MKKWRTKLRLKLYDNLALKIQGLLPKDFDPVVDILPPLPPYKKECKDLVVIQLRIPHDLTKKLMWALKPWKEN